MVSNVQLSGLEVISCEHRDVAPLILLDDILKELHGWHDTFILK